VERGSKGKRTYISFKIKDIWANKTNDLSRKRKILNIHQIRMRAITSLRNEVIVKVNKFKKLMRNYLKILGGMQFHKTKTSGKTTNKTSPNPPTPTNPPNTKTKSSRP
jgi:hypothetical protein